MFYPRADRTAPWGDDSRNIICSPIWSRLPAESQGYREDDGADFYDVSRMLTAFQDENLCRLKGEVYAFPDNYLNPETARADALDWLAQAVGMIREYWNPEWDEGFKRWMIANSMNLWPERGSGQALELILEAYGTTTCVTPQVWLVPDFVAGESQAAAYIRGNPYIFFVRVPLDAYQRDGTDWREIRRFTRLWSPAWVRGVLCYCYFYAGASVAGDGIFDPVFELTDPVLIEWRSQNPVINERNAIVFDYAHALKVGLDTISLPATTTPYYLFAAGDSIPASLGPDRVHVVVDDSVEFRGPLWKEGLQVDNIWKPYPLAVFGRSQFRAGFSQADQFLAPGILQQADWGAFPIITEGDRWDQTVEDLRALLHDFALDALVLRQGPNTPLSKSLPFNMIESGITAYIPDPDEGDELRENQRLVLQAVSLIERFYGDITVAPMASDALEELRNAERGDGVWAPNIVVGDRGGAGQLQAGQWFTAGIFHLVDWTLFPFLDAGDRWAKTIPDLQYLIDEFQLNALVLSQGTTESSPTTLPFNFRPPRQISVYFPTPHSTPGSTENHRRLSQVVDAVERVTGDIQLYPMDELLLEELRNSDRGDGVWAPNIVVGDRAGAGQLQADQWFTSGMARLVDWSTFTTPTESDRWEQAIPDLQQLIDEFELDAVIVSQGGNTDNTLPLRFNPSRQVTVYTPDPSESEDAFTNWTELKEVITLVQRLHGDIALYTLPSPELEQLKTLSLGDGVWGPDISTQLNHPALGVMKLGQWFNSGIEDLVDWGSLPDEPGDRWDRVKAEIDFLITLSGIDATTDRQDHSRAGSAILPFHLRPTQVSIFLPLPDGATAVPDDNLGTLVSPLEGDWLVAVQILDLVRRDRSDAKLYVTGDDRGGVPPAHLD